MGFLREYELCRQMIEAKLDTYFREEGPDAGLREAMRYSLLAGGKRIRPVLVVKFCEAAGGDGNSALDLACAVEMLHTYSLIHDDLPCMDNDDLRRGKPTCHKVFGETVATLAGDALQTAAFQTAAEAGRALGDSNAALAAVLALAQAAGESGMCGGQYLDTIGDGASHTVEKLLVIHSKKTGALLRAACLMGVCAAGRAKDNVVMEAAGRYAEELGIAFQIQDDILDASSTTEVLGKPVGSDASNGKTTYVTLLGIPVCKQLVLEHTECAKQALKGMPGDHSFLCWLADELAQRNH